jgi:GDP-4-dehydro-6-deoxy-D-mannose reductase
MRTLITGVTGFVGGHLVESLRGEPGQQLFGLARTTDWPAAWSHLAGTLPVHAADLLDGAAVERVVREVRPDRVFHLAGYANTGKSFREPDECWAVNLTGTRTLYDAILRTDIRPRVLFASTGLVYGDPDEPGQPCNESTTLKPASPYAASKAAADVMSYQYSRTTGLPVIRVRLFNQIGPRQPADYAVANFARQIAAIEAGRMSPILETGDLSAHRDLTDVRDMVKAMRLLLEQGTPGEAYNAGRGRTWQIREVLDRVLKFARRPIEVRSKVEPGRAADTTVTRADVTKLVNLTGWQTTYDLDQSLTDILTHWRVA